ncbi:Uncharacterised protein [Mycobacteroides abscessus subsp. abscessus]|nr:Uncharacterised protein [Mycobacteroides abscessus subsp. abscessus]
MRNPCSNPGSTSSVTSAPGGMRSSAPSSGVNVSTGDVLPSSVPRKMSAVTSPTVIAGGA